MIVKNESQTLPRCLRSVESIVCDKVVADTGSSDNTKQVLADFSCNVVDEPFVNFGDTRTKALYTAYAQSTSEYVLLLDADMELIVVDPDAFYSALAKQKPDVVYVFQRLGTLLYENIRILRNKLNVRCIGPTHEFYEVPQDASVLHFPVSTVFVRDHCDGGCRSHKFQRDKELLSEALKSDPTNARNVFYYAQTLRDLGDYDGALQAYHTRVQLGGWLEEVLYSLYSVVKIYLYEKHDVDACVQTLSTLEELSRPLGYVRVEPYYHLCKHYRCSNDVPSAVKYYAKACLNLRLLDKSRPPLFYETDVEEYLLPFEEHVLWYHLHPKYASAAVPLCLDLVNNENVPQAYKDAVLHNMKTFYLSASTE